MVSNKFSLQLARSATVTKQRFENKLRLNKRLRTLAEILQNILSCRNEANLKSVQQMIVKVFRLFNKTELKH